MIPVYPTDPDSQDGGRRWLPHGRIAAPPPRDTAVRRSYSLLGALSVGTGLVMIAMLVVLIIAVFGSIYRVQDATSWAKRSQVVGRELHDLLILVAVAETSQRGYLLTNDPKYLEPYAQAQRDIEIDIGKLHTVSAENYQLQRQLRQAETLIRAKFAEMQSAIDEMQSGRPDLVRAQLHSGRGRELTRQIQALDIDTYGAEQKLTEDWEIQQRGWERKALRTVAAIALLGMLLVITAVCVVMLYLSQRARTERELRVARDDAVAANQAKSRFLAAASHDLRQPLHALNLLLRTLERRIGETKDAELVRGARAASVSMARMFDGLLEISRLDAGIVEPDLEDFPLQDLLAELRAAYQAPAHSKGLALELDAEPVILTTDRALLRSMLTNLINNAITFTQEGSITMIARNGEHGVRIEVCDTGRGIPENEQGRVFDEFHRLEQTAPTQAHGLGLGLSIVRRMAALLDIDVELRSQVSQGSVFSLCVPKAVTTAPAAAGRSATAVQPDIDLRGKTVLLVDDEPLGREAMRCEMGDWGMNVVLAADAEEALRFLKARQIQLDVAIVDRDLGSDISGPELLDRLATDLGIAVPAIVITGATDADSLQDLEETGYTYLIKPVDEIALRRALNLVMADPPASPSMHTEAS